MSSLLISNGGRCSGGKSDLHIGVCFFEANGFRLKKRLKTDFFQTGS